MMTEQQPFPIPLQEQIACALMARVGIKAAEEYRLTTSCAGFLEMTRVTAHNQTRYLLPCVFNGHQLHFKSILKPWRGKRYSNTKESFLFNGQPNEGCSTVVHYGHSGRCVAWAPLDHCTWFNTSVAKSAIELKYQEAGIGIESNAWVLQIYNENDELTQLEVTAKETSHV